MNTELSLDLASLREAYTGGTVTPEQVIDLVYDRIAARGEDRVWIHLVPREQARAAAAALAKRRDNGDSLPLQGVPFAIKDNLDVAGLPTTAACPEFTYTATETSPVVAALLEAGAILIGKTNLDQFATGLVGTRSPYGAPSCVFDEKVISGGSSSGSAVAVAAGLVSFALGTDTAGSGRVPAAFNNLIGWKPTRGLLSTRGLVPACRSLDCVAVFALTSADVAEVMAVTARYDEADPHARPEPAPGPVWPAAFRFGVPRRDQLEFFGDMEAAALFEQAVGRLEKLGGLPVEIDYTPFRETAELLYSGPWVAERLAAVTPFIDEHPGALHPVTAKIIEGGRRFNAVDTFRAFYRLEELRRRAGAEWAKMEVLLLPTTGTVYTHEQVAADPVQLNTNLGYYTNFVNLLDLCGMAIPAGFRTNGLPFGVTLLAPAFRDHEICDLGARSHRALGGKLGGTDTPLALLPAKPVAAAAAMPTTRSISLAVVGAHLTGQPLNHQLTSLGASLVRTTKTAKGYRFYALPGTVPPKPGLVRDHQHSGPGIEVEVWDLDEAGFGAFVAKVPSPLVIGTVILEDATEVKGFLCEPFAVNGAREITHFGGWRAYLGSHFALQKEPPCDVTPSGTSSTHTTPACI